MSLSTQVRIEWKAEIKRRLKIKNEINKIANTYNYVPKAVYMEVCFNFRYAYRVYFPLDE